MKVLNCRLYLKYDVFVFLSQFKVSHTGTTWMEILLKKCVSLFQTTPSLIPIRPGRRTVPITATHARQTTLTPTYWTVTAFVFIFHLFCVHGYRYNLFSSTFVEYSISRISLLMWSTISNIHKIINQSAYYIDTRDLGSSFSYKS